MVVPAHDEEELIGGTLMSLLDQTRRPDRIVVVADNCTDRTVEIARNLGVEVYTTVGNTAKKAGALNQVFWRVRSMDLVLQVDADMQFDRRFVEEMVAGLQSTPAAGGLTGRVGVQAFRGGGPVRWTWWMLQRLEYYYYDSIKVANGGKVWCLSGTGGIYRSEVLRAVSAGRRGPWDEDSIVEDYSLSLDIEELGWKTGSVSRAFSWSDTMPTFSMLWRQRMRWNQGTYLEWKRRPPTSVVNADRRSHRWGLALALLNPLFILLTLSVIVLGAFQVTALSLALTGLFAADRAYRLRYVPRRSLADVIVALLIFPEFCYRLLLDLNLFVALVRARRSTTSARHLAW